MLAYPGEWLGVRALVKAPRALHPRRCRLVDEKVSDRPDCPARTAIWKPRTAASSILHERFKIVEIDLLMSQSTQRRISG